MPTYNSDSWYLVILDQNHRQSRPTKRLTVSLTASIGSDPAVHADSSTGKHQRLAFPLVQETLDVRDGGGLRDMGERVDVPR